MYYISFSLLWPSFLLVCCSYWRSTLISNQYKNNNIILHPDLSTISVNKIFIENHTITLSFNLLPLAHAGIYFSLSWLATFTFTLDLIGPKVYKLKLLRNLTRRKHLHRAKKIIDTLSRKKRFPLLGWPHMCRARRPALPDASDPPRASRINSTLGYNDKVLSKIPYTFTYQIIIF